MCSRLILYTVLQITTMTHRLVKNLETFRKENIHNCRVRQAQSGSECVCEASTEQLRVCVWIVVFRVCVCVGEWVGGWVCLCSCLYACMAIVVAQVGLPVNACTYEEASSSHLLTMILLTDSHVLTRALIWLGPDSPQELPYVAC